LNRGETWRHFDPGWIVVVALCLVAVWPFLSQPGLPRETDAELHVFRVAELAHLMRQGELYPRWASDFYYGYGYPLFNFYGPLTYYVGVALAALPGVSVVGGVKAVFLLGIALSGLGTYAFARDRWGGLGGVLAATAYVYAPYLQLFDPYLRGNLAEGFTFAIIPWVLWAFGRLATGGGWLYLAGVAVGWSALLVTHNVMAVLLSALLVAYAAFTWLTRREWRVYYGQTFTLSALALALGLGLSAFYWLPVFAERRFVQNENIIQGYFDFHEHFVSLGELLSPAKIQDLGATFPDFRFNIGLGQVILVGIVLLLIFYKVIKTMPAGCVRSILQSPQANILGNADPEIPPERVEGRSRRGGQTHINCEKSTFVRFCGRSVFELAFWLIVTLGLVLFMLPSLVRVWEAVPPLAYVQFPWKLLGPLALAVAMLTGGLPWLARELGGESLALPATVLGASLVLFTALPNTFPPPWDPDFGGATVLDHLHFERQGRAVGTTSAAEYLPIWVKAKPGPSAWLTDAYEEGRPLNKLDPASLPSDAQVVETAHSPATDRFVLESPQPFTARVLTFYFPGWRAWVDGEPAEIVPHSRRGFITVQVPAGRHTLELYFGSTPSRTVGTAISVVSLLTLVGLALLVRSPMGMPRVGDRDAPLLRDWASLLGLAFLFFIVKVAVIDRQPNWFRVTSTGFEARPAQDKLQANFSNQVMLLGYDLPNVQVVSGGEIPLTLYWKAIKPVLVNYSVFVHLVRPPEHLWGQDDRLNPADFPMTRWPVDKYVRDRHRLPVLPGTPPGEYEIEVGFYRQDSGERLLVLEAEGISGGVRLPSKVQVLPPRSQPAVESLDMQHRTDVPVTDGLTLLGWSLNGQAFTPPDFAHLTLFWQAEQDVSKGLTFAVALLDETEGKINELYGPVDGFYPTANWRQGEIVRDQYAFWLEKGMMPGRYRLQLKVMDELLTLIEIEIRREGG
jgi:hypothetical protein